MIDFFRWIESFAQDLRYAARNLRRAPGLVVVSMLSLALGFGLNLTLYAAVNTIFRHEPTMNDPARVVGIEPGNGRQYSYLNYRDLREQGGFEAVTGFRIGGMNRRVGDDLERLGVLIVTDNFFEALGVRARLGRTFTADEAAPERRPRLVVLDHPYWSARYGADPGVIGQTMILDGEPFEVIGVLPESYRSVTGFMTPGAYVPVSALTLATLNDRGSPTLSVLARLAPGTTRGWAQAAATSVGARLERDFPEMNEGLARPAQVFAVDAMQFRGTPAGFRIFPVVLLILFGLVLLIGSVNVAGLLLARATAREHELTIRAALGASRARVIQTMLVESFLLSLLGASAGLLLALAFAETGLPGPLAGLSETIAPDRRLLVPGLLLVLATTLLCGAVPALRSARANVVTALRKGGTGTTARFNARSAFIVGQVAVSLMLLVVSSLCLRSQMRIFTVDVGFDLDHGAVARFTAETPRPAAARAVFIDQLVERIERTPGVRSAAVTSLVPLGGDALVASFHPAGRSDIPGTRPSTVSVGPRYFETLAIPLLRGREFTAADREGTPGGGDRQPDVCRDLLRSGQSAWPACRDRWRSRRRDCRRGRQQQARHDRRSAEVGGLLSVRAAAAPADRDRADRRRSGRHVAGGAPRHDRARFGSGCLRRDAQRRGQHGAEHAARRHAVRRRDRDSRPAADGDRLVRGRVVPRGSREAPNWAFASRSARPLAAYIAKFSATRPAWSAAELRSAFPRRSSLRWR